MERFIFVASSEADTERLGAALAESLPLRATIALNGTLGAGKTRLVQALAAAAGVPRGEVVSPTFVLCLSHQGRRLLHHVDVYRLHDEDEFLHLGPDDWFDAPGLTVIEWAERVASCLPTERLEIGIAVGDGTSRTFDLVAHGAELQAALDLVARKLAP